MPTATVTVRYVNQPKPGAKTGSIKTADGAYYSVWPDKLSQFQQNGIYEIEYSEKDGDNGKVWRTVVSAVPKGQALPPQRGGGFRGGSGGGYRPTDPKDAERMFVCSLLNAGIQAGKVDLSTVAVSAAVNALRNAWAETFGADAPAAQEAQQAPQPQQPPNRAAEQLIWELRQRETVARLKTWGLAAAASIADLNEADKERVRGEYSGRLKALTQAENLAA